MWVTFLDGQIQVEFNALCRDYLLIQFNFISEHFPQPTKKEIEAYNKKVSLGHYIDQNGNICKNTKKPC